MGEVKITPISPNHGLGEGPHWIEKDQSLVYVSINEGKIHRYFHNTKRIQNIQLEDLGTGTAVPFVIPVDGTIDQFIVAVGRTIAYLEWSPSEPDNQTKRAKSILSVESADLKTRFNDAKCDPAGRLVAGTMNNAFGPPFTNGIGSLYSLNQDLKHSQILDKVTISNGLAWDEEKSIFYFIDSLEYSVDAFDYDKATGNISNRRTVLDFKKPPGVNGLPDGMCIDANGNLWVVCHDAFQIICVEPSSGKILKTLDIPARRVTSCCWGGPDYSTLFVTSASISADDDFATYPHTGKTFAVTGLDARGKPPHNFKLNRDTLNKLI